MTCEAFAPHRRGSALDRGWQYSLAHQASARLNIFGGEGAALSIAEGAGMATKPAGLIGTSRPGNRFCRVRNCPRTKVTQGRTPLGLEPPLRVSRALRWPGRDRKKTLESSTTKVPALHQEAEHDATRRIGRQHSVHTWIGDHVQGKRRSLATLCHIHGELLKVRLTV